MTALVPSLSLPTIVLQWWVWPCEGWRPSTDPHTLPLVAIIAAYIDEGLT